MAAMWEIEFPIRRENGARGVQTFVVRSDFQSDARDQALVDVASPDAARHRRDAEVDVTGLTIRLWTKK